MDVPLYQLVYYSRNRIKGRPDDVSKEIELILAKARRNNHAAGLTGALIFNSNLFAQVLEGTGTAVEKTFETIQRDPRHGDLEILAFKPAAKRIFPHWSMAFVGRSRSHESVFGSMGEETGFDAQRFGSDRILGILHQMALEEDEALSASSG